jgi:hypothetical protein
VNTSVAAEPRAQSTWRATWPFWLAVPLFLLVTLIDTGRSWTRVAGQSPGSVMTFLVIAAGLLNVRAKAFGLASVATGLIALVVAWHVLVRGESLTAAYRLMGPMLLAWVVALQRADTAFVMKLLKMLLALSAIFAVTFYFGLWREENGVWSFPNINRNNVALNLAFGAASLVVLGRQGQLGSLLKRGWPIAVLIMVVPIVFTASRKGLIAAGLIPIVYFGVVSRRFRAYQVLVGIGMLILLIYVAGQGYVEALVEPMERVTQRFEAGDEIRTNFAALGVDLIRREPLLGYGISAPYDPMWLAANGFADDVTGQPLSLHNALLVYGVMAGLPFVALYLLFLFATLLRLVLPPSALPVHRDLSAGAAVLLFAIIITLASGGGSEHWKYGWFVIGATMLIADVVKREGQR